MAWRATGPTDFYPRSPCGERRTQTFTTSGFSLFLSTLSLRRATVLRVRPAAGRRHFYPRSPCGERPRAAFLKPSSPRFLSTLSLRRATSLGPGPVCWRIISIHALLAESDATAKRAEINTADISIHALLAESDLRETVPGGRHVIFLSTLSLRRATNMSKSLNAKLEDFYPRSPCGERLTQFWQLHPKYPISIHALLAESDRPDRGKGKPRQRISIHALLAESDRRLLYILCGAHDFYPRSPCGERPAITRVRKSETAFLSTLSLRRATHHQLNMIP